MNAERLHAICLAIRQEVIALEIEPQLSQLVEIIESLADGHSVKSSQTELAEVVKRIDSTLSKSPSDKFSPAWRQAADDLGASPFLGIKLRVSIHRILERNQITFGIALSEMTTLRDGVASLKTATDNVIKAFETLNIGAETLSPGECEIGFLVPRGAIHDNLRELGEEFEELYFILGTFSEVSTGHKTNCAVKTLASTDLMVYLAAVPPLAACIAHAAEKIIDLYKKLLEIKKLKAELKKQGLAEKELQGISDHATAAMETGIEKLTIEIMTQHFKGKDGNRKNELTNAVRISLNKLANRIDLGFNIEVRAEPPKAQAEKASAEDIAIAKHIERVHAASAALHFLKPDGERILQLPEKTEKPKPKS